MVNNNDGVPIGLQIVHHAGQTFEIIGVQADRRLIKNIKDTGRAVADCPCELHPLTFTRGERRSRPIKRQISKPEIHQPLGNVHKGFADVFRHRAHLFRKRRRNPLHPGDQFRECHSRCLI